MYTSETKIEDFVQEYMRSRIGAETTVRAVLKRATEYEDLFKTLSVNNVGDVFNQIAKAEDIKEDGQILQVQDITSGSIQDVVADIQRQKDAFLELRQTAGVTYKEIAQAAKEYSKVYNKAEGQNFEFFKR